MKHLFLNFIFYSMFLLFGNTFVTAQNTTFNSSEIYEQLKALPIFGSILYIGVTPADKDVPLLTYFSIEKKYRTAFLSITRGESLYNKYSREEGRELGLIHVAEGIEQSNIINTENFYTSAYDIGASINRKQVASVWDTGRILSDVVWVIRSFQPDVIITSYQQNEDSLTTEQKVSASIIEKAFLLAGDSSAFSNQLKYGIDCWQPNRLLYDATHDTNTHQSSKRINTNIFNPASGLTTSDIAISMMHYQKTLYTDSSNFNNQISLKFLAGDSLFTDITDGMGSDWRRLNENAFKTIQPLEDSIISNYNFLHPQLSLPELIKTYKTLDSLKINNNWKKRKLSDIQKLIFLCSGLSIKAFSNQSFAVPGDSLNIQVAVSKRAPVNAELEDISYPDYSDSILHINIPYLQNFTIKKTIPVNKDKQATQPYWLSNTQTMPYMYNIDDQYLVGKEYNDPEYTVYVSIKIDSIELFTILPVKYMPFNNYINNVPEQNVSTILPIITSLTPNTILTNVKPGNDFTNNPQLNIKFKSNISKDSLPVKIKVSQLGFNLTINGKNITTIKRNGVFEIDSIINLSEGESYSINIPLKNTTLLNKDSSVVLGATISAKINGDTRFYSSSLKTISYNYLPPLNYYYRDLTKVIPDEIKTGAGRIGYLFSGNDDWMLYALQQLGYTVKTLTPGDFVYDSLRHFKAIVLGINVQDIDASLQDKYDTLINYVSNGGNLIFFDNRNEINLNRPFKISSAPLKILVDETQTSFTSTGASVFNYPNKITQPDFQQWKRNFIDFVFYNFDTSFQTPLAFKNDDNNTIIKNALLIKQFHKGNFIFSGISLPSQVAAGVTGAYKLLANIIDFPMNKDQ